MATKISQIKVAEPGAYSSEYADKIASSMNNAINFKYDPMQDASYKALAKVYRRNGEKAAQSTMADAASLNGGYNTSYATSAAEQVRNDYNQQLAGYIPELEEKAYNRNLDALGIYQDADRLSYDRYRDAVADYQWGQGYNLDVYAAKKSRSSGGGGRGSGGGYSSAYVGQTAPGIPSIPKGTKNDPSGQVGVKKDIKAIGTKTSATISKQKNAELKKKQNQKSGIW